MKKQIIAVAVLSALALSPLAFAASVQGSNSTPTTQWDSQGDMASGPGSYAAGTTQTPGTQVQCIAGPAGTTECGFVGAAPGQPANQPGYLPSYASGLGAYAGPGKGQTIFGNDMAVGNFSTALGVASTAVGNYAGALGNGSTAVGYASSASGLNATAAGVGSSASGAGSVADGVGAAATGWQSVATGDQASASGAFADATGPGASASGFGSTADGASATATGSGATALGSNTVAKGDNSVALGRGSVANRPNTVSVGNSANGMTMTRGITNVSAGTQGTDAVNVNQLQGTAANLHQQITSSAQQLQQQFSSGLAGVHSYATQEADSVGALSAATADAAFSAAGLHTPNRIALGVGEMGGQVAESVAYQHAFGRNWTASATVADGTAGMQVGVGAGFGW